MSARPFKPLWLSLPGREPRRIDNAFDALECLITAWPNMAFRSHHRAVRACRDALDGFTSAERARRMLVEAALDIDAATTSAPLAEHRFVPGGVKGRPQATGKAPKYDAVVRKEDRSAVPRPARA